MKPNFKIERLDNKSSIVKFTKVCFSRPTTQEVEELFSVLSKTKKLVLDLSNTEQMTTIWFKQFVLLLEEAEPLNKQIFISGISDHLRKNITMTGLNNLLGIIIK